MLEKANQIADQEFLKRHSDAKIEHSDEGIPESYHLDLAPRFE
jgi:hypothetical protein